MMYSGALSGFSLLLIPDSVSSGWTADVSSVNRLGCGRVCLLLSPALILCVHVTCGWCE